jgi:parallel beta-helix repeat protein
LFGNTISDSSVGIKILSSFNNTFSGNDVTNISAYGIWLYSSSNNSISQNSVAASYIGIQVEFSFNNTFSGNNVTNNSDVGINLFSSSGNILRRNVMDGNAYNFGVVGGNMSDFVNDVDVSNTVDGKPIYYLIGVQDFAVPLDAGYVVLVNSSFVTVQNLNLTKNWGGIQLAYTTNATIARNNITDNSCGIYLYSSFNNTASENNVENNSVIGIYLISSSNNTLSGNNITTNSNDGIYLSLSSNNTIYLNDFNNNTNQVYSYNSTNIWDNGSIGNYWSDYQTKYPNATETNSSGVWNTPYVIDWNNTDYYPLTVPIAVVPEFPSFLILPIFMIATLLAVIVYKKKGVKTSHRQNLEKTQ